MKGWRALKQRFLQPKNIYEALFVFALFARGTFYANYRLVNRRAKVTWQDRLRLAVVVIVYGFLLYFSRYVFIPGLHGKVFDIGTKCSVVVIIASSLYDVLTHYFLRDNFVAILTIIDTLDSNVSNLFYLIIKLVKKYCLL